MASTMYAEGLFIQNRVKWDLICYSCDDVLGWVIIDLPPALNLASWLADWLDGDSLAEQEINLPINVKVICFAFLIHRLCSK